nr:prealbumin-like fold domain-containing protein [Bifidobacterium amazonense]
MLSCWLVGGSTARADDGATSTVTSVDAYWLVWSNSAGSYVPTLMLQSFDGNAGTVRPLAQFDLSASGQSMAEGGNMIPANSLEWRIPQYVFKDRDGNPTGIDKTQIAVPECSEGYNSGNGLCYTVDESTHEFVLTNAITVSAAATFSVQVNYGVDPSEVPDADTTPGKDYYGYIEGEIISTGKLPGNAKPVESIKTTAKINTSLIITDVEKDYSGTTDTIPEGFEDAAGDGERYVLWKITVKAEGKQPGTVTINDGGPTDDLYGWTVGFLDSSKKPITDENGDQICGAWETECTVPISGGGTYTYYVITGYSQSDLDAAMAADDGYTLANSVSATVTGKDDDRSSTKDAEDSKTIGNTKSFSYSGDLYRMFKGCAPNVYAAGADALAVGNSCETLGALTALENDSDVHLYPFVNHYFAQTYALTTEDGTASDDQGDYGQQYVRHEFIDDMFAFGEETAGEMEQNGTYPDGYQENYPEPTKGYAELTPEDFSIERVGIPKTTDWSNYRYQQGSSDYRPLTTSPGFDVSDWALTDTGDWGLVSRTPSSDQGKTTLTIEGLLYGKNGDGPWVNQGWKTLGVFTLQDLYQNAKSIDTGYTSGSNSSIVAVRAVYQSASSAAVELNLAVSVVLRPTDHVKGLLHKLNDSKTASTAELRDDYVTLTDFNTMTVYTQKQLEATKSKWPTAFNLAQAERGEQVNGGASIGACMFLGSAGTNGWHGKFNTLPFSHDFQYLDSPASSPFQGVPLCHTSATQKLTPFSLTSVKEKTIDGTATNDTVNSRVKIPYEVTMGESGIFTSNYVINGWANPQQSGTFYDLLPAGVVPDTASVNVTATDDTTAMTVTDIQTHANYKGSGRTLLTVTAKAPNGYKNVQYSTSNTDATGKSTMTLHFDAYISWQDAGDYGYNNNAKPLHNVVAYESGNKTITKGDDNDDLTGLDDKTLCTTASGCSWGDDEKSALANLTANNTDNRFLYADASNRISFITSSSSGLTKHIRGGTQIDWTNGMKNEVKLRAGGEYTYRLRYTADSSTSASGIVLYDSLENYLSTDTSASDQAVTTSTPRWRGTLSSVDVRQATDDGFAPVVYCSTRDDLKVYGPTDSDNEYYRKLTNIKVWSDCTPSTHADYDYSKVKAVAIDLTKTSGGTDATLAPGKSVQVVLVMNAPTGADAVAEYVADDAHAYNGTHVKTTTARQGEGGAAVSAVSDIDFGYTRVGLVADTTTFTFTKVDGSAAETKPLAGATFTVYRWVGSGEAPTSGLIDTNALGSDWRQVGDARTSDGDGKVSLGGLMVGVYRLVETKAPDGFDQPDCQWRIAVEAGPVNKELVIHEPTVVRATDADASGKPVAGVDRRNPAFAESNGGLVLANYPGSVLPETGGVGPWMMIGVGAAMVTLSASYYAGGAVARRRRR